MRNRLMQHVESPEHQRPMRAWPAYAAALWAGVFAARAVYWALGGTVGLGTLSQGLQELAAEGEATVFAALWIVAMLLGAGAVLALAVARSWSLRVPHRVPLAGGWAPPAWMLLMATAGAGGLLALHGAGYISLLATADTSTSEVRWYGLLWGPWFLLGGVLYLLAAHRFARRCLPDRAGLATLVGGAVAGVAVGAAPRALTWLMTL